MEFSLEYTIRAPATDTNDPERDYQRYPDVAYISAVATRRPSFYDYNSLLMAAYAKMSAHLQKMQERGFRAYIFLIGMDMNEEKIRKFPNYRLWNKAARFNIRTARSVEQDIDVLYGIRRIGIFEIYFEDISLCFEFQSKSNDCIVVLSKSEDFMSHRMLQNMYKLSQTDGIHASVQLRWGMFVADLCRSGHAIAQECGRFDDLERGITICMSLSNWHALR